MKLPAFIRKRLQFRLHVYQTMVFTCMASIALTLGVFVFEPSIRSERQEGHVWAGRAALAARGDSSELESLVAEMRERGRLGITVFAVDGQIVATSERLAPPPLTPPVLARLERERAVSLDADTIAVASAEDGGLTAYAVLVRKATLPLWLRMAPPITMMILVVVLSSIPLLRVVVRPIERLTRVTQDFGMGDLRIRAAADRDDEIGNLARTFNLMADRIETLRKAEKELLANVSHELRTPLARIRVVLELAIEEEEERQSAIAKQHFADIAEDLTELERILDDIIGTARLDLANERSEDPYPPLRRTPIQVSATVDALVKRLRKEQPGRAVRCSMEEDLTLSADRVMLKHAVSNILTNAHKYSPIDRPIEISLCRADDGAKAMLSVRDHGQGIAADDLPRVFDPFFRADRSRTRGTGGVGLGLTLARRIVEAHGGEITLASQCGEGTTVTMTFPLDGTAARV